MAITYTAAGDFTVTQVGPALFTVTVQPAGAIAYFDSRDRAEAHGRDMAQSRAVSLWYADGRPSGNKRLIVSYRAAP